jgi:KUP system potassium uptake protein
MSARRWGSRILRRSDSTDERVPLSAILAENRSAPRIAGKCGVLLSAQSFKSELMDYIERFGALPERLLVLTLEEAEDARVPDDERYTLRNEAPGVESLLLRVGFAERPNISAAMEWAAEQGHFSSFKEATFFELKRALVVDDRSEKRQSSRLRRRLFAFLFRQSVPTWQVLPLPSERVVEIGVSEYF